MDKDTLRKIKKSYLAGRSLRETGRDHGLSHLVVRRALLDAGVPMRLPGFRNPHRNAQIMDMHEQGETLQAIGTALGVSRQRIHQVIAKEKKQHGQDSNSGNGE